MKRLFFFLILPSALIYCSIVYFSAFQNKPTRPDKVKKDYLEDLYQFQSNLSSLQEQLNHTKYNQKKIKSQFIQTRLSFKRIEWLIEYLDAEFTKDFVNGPPLPKLERKVANVRVLEPKGLQIMEELIVHDLSKNLNQIKALNTELLEKINQVIPLQEAVKLTDRQIIEAIRFELIRIYTLGITGFDTPGGLNTIQENKVALEECWEIIQTYYPLFVEDKILLVKDIDQIFKSGIQYLSQESFDDLDRMYFLKSVINPLYKKILELQISAQIETIDLVNPLVQAVNYHTENLFDNQFLNKDYFTISKVNNESEVAQIGKLLFFDPILSKDNKRACASCHNPEKAFADGKAKSLAFGEEGTVSRNSPGLINAVYSKGFFHDLRASRLEDQSEHVIFSPKEFNTNYFQIIEKLESSPDYQKMFKQAFPKLGRHTVSKYSISVALACYVRSLSGFNSTFDQYVRDEIDHLDEEVIKGYNLFMGKAACGTCHFAPTFNGTVPPNFKETESEVLGVPADKDKTNAMIDPDHGRYKSGKMMEHSKIYDHSFKTPTIRNIELTEPYMHNGVFDSLEEVMEFYNEGGGIGLGYEVPNQTLPFDSLSLEEDEMDAIISFMKSLTDTSGLTSIPKELPTFTIDSLNNRKIQGIY